MKQKQDILHRQEYVNKLIQVVNCISKKKSSCCFAIDGQWGSGKTYVLDMFEEKIRKYQSEEISDSRYFVFNFNCWKYDYYEEPSIAIIASMLDEIKKEKQLFDKKTTAIVKSSWNKANKIICEIAGEFSKNKIGIDFIEVVKDIKKDADKILEDDHSFDKMFSFKKTLSHTRKKLSELSKEKSILFIVDELDRCLPHYAIKVMERLHHLFDEIDNITVLLAVDSKQLSYSIKKIYGKEIDVEKYLKKFINFTLVLDIGKTNEQFENKYSDYFNYFSTLNEEDRIFFRDLFSKIFSEMDIRTQEKMMSKAKLIHDIITDKKNLNPALLCVEIVWLVFSYRRNSHNLKWIPDITPHTLYAFSEPMMNEHLTKYLQSIQESSVKHITNTRPLEVNNTLNGNIFWIFASLYYEVNNNVCSKYRNANADNLKIEVQLIKEFVSLAMLMG